MKRLTSIIISAWSIFVSCAIAGVTGVASSRLCTNRQSSLISTDESKQQRTSAFAIALNRSLRSTAHVPER